MNIFISEDMSRGVAYHDLVDNRIIFILKFPINVLEDDINAGEEYDSIDLNDPTFHKEIPANAIDIDRMYYIEMVDVEDVLDEWDGIPEKRTAEYTEEDLFDIWEFATDNAVGWTTGASHRSKIERFLYDNMHNLRRVFIERLMED